MTVALDVRSTLASGTGDRNWSHAGGGSARSALVIIADGVATDQVVGVTYGGVAMVQVPLSPIINTSGEGGSVHAYFLDNCGTGTKTVAIDRADATSYIAACYTQTGTELCVLDTSVSNSDSDATPDAVLSIGSASSFVAGGIYSGDNAVTTSNPAPLSGSQNDVAGDFGTDGAVIGSGTSIKTADYTYGWTQTANDATLLVIAISEVVKVTKTDSGVGTETAVVSQAKSASDSGVGTETASLAAAITVGGSDLVQGSQVVADDFSGSSGSSWPAADTGGSYSGNYLNGRGAVTYSEGGGQGGMYAAVGQTQGGSEALTSISKSDIELQVYAVHNNTTSQALEVYARIQNAASYYKVAIVRNATETQASLWIADTSQLGASINLGSATVFLVRFQLYGSRLRVKVWESGTNEPGSWQIDETDTTYAGPGKVGLGGVDVNDQGIFFDNFNGWDLTAGAGGESGIGTETGIKSEGEDPNKVSTESGTGTDSAATVAAASQVTDAGTGTDTRTGLGLATADAGAATDVQTGLGITTVDAGAGTDTRTGLGIATNDAGTGSDSLARIDLVATDAGTGTDSRTSLSLTTTDAGTGIDTQTGLGIGVNDAGTGSESGRVGIVVADTGTGTDSQTGLGLAATDAGTGTDARTSLGVATADAGSGSESGGVGLATVDAGVGSDLALVTAVLLGTDAGTGSDGGVGIEVVASDSGVATETGIKSEGESPDKFSTDAGVATDTATTLAQTDVRTDVGTATDVASLAAALVGTDAATGSEAVAGIVLQPVETGTGTDSVATVAATSQVTDAGTATDSATLVAVLPTLTDGGVGSDPTPLVNKGGDVSSAESGVGTDSSVAPLAVLTSSDAGAGVETLASIALSAVDAGTGADSATVNLEKTASDSASGTDIVASRVIMSSDAGVGTESTIIAALFAQSDSGVGTELAALAAGYVVTDSGVGVDTSTPLGKEFFGADTGTGSDVAALAALLVALDAGVSSDSLSGRSLHLAEVGIGLELGVIKTAGGSPTPFSGQIVGRGLTGTISRHQHDSTIQQVSRTGTISKRNESTGTIRRTK